PRPAPPIARCSTRAIRRTTRRGSNCRWMKIRWQVTFAKLKALLRARAERTIAALWDTVGALVDLFTPTECANYFKAAGYEPD
ncbi:hypothetical protein NKI25_31840, partial [Mesorhizobium sp. M0808]